tara:strand:- start:423 stop:800 length:378 start_codon:yes stop_codon:yes gene_type:complete
LTSRSFSDNVGIPFNNNGNEEKRMQSTTDLYQENYEATQCHYCECFSDVLIPYGDGELICTDCCDNERPPTENPRLIAERERYEERLRQQHIAEFKKFQKSQRVMRIQESKDLGRYAFTNGMHDV